MMMNKKEEVIKYCLIESQNGDELMRMHSYKPADYIFHILSFYAIISEVISKEENIFGLIYFYLQSRLMIYSIDSSLIESMKKHNKKIKNQELEFDNEAFLIVERFIIYVHKKLLVSNSKAYKEVN